MNCIKDNYTLIAYSYQQDFNSCKQLKCLLFYICGGRGIRYPKRDSLYHETSDALKVNKNVHTRKVSLVRVKVSPVRLSNKIYFSQKCS